jgi:autotransporter family porin
MPGTSIVNFVPGQIVANFLAVGMGTGGVCLAVSAPVHLVVDLMGWFTGSSDFRGAAPTRLLDTRVTHDALAAGTERHLSLSAGNGYNGGTGGVALNITVVSPQTDGYVTVYPCGARPQASTVNFRAGEIVPNFTLVPYANGEVCIYSFSATDLVVDSFGWSGGGGMTLAAPARVLDTRSGLGWSGGAVGPAQTLSLRVAGRGGVPNDASAALLTITATGGTADGFVTAWPCDQPRPVASVLNLRSGLLRSNLALLALAADGSVCLYAYTVDGSPVHLVADAVGWLPGGPNRQPPPPDPAPTPTPPTGGTAHFGTLPVGAALPSDADCAARVRAANEVRPQNTTYNHTKGFGPPSNPPQPLYARITGNFTGTTDEILQWGACKWGIDEDIVRAQAVKESYWTQTNVGDGGDSFGILQVRQSAWGWAFNNGVGDPKSSTAYNVDVALAARRNCFEGNETWLNTVERGKDYAAGDIWGCVGLWFSGRWYTPDSVSYINDVQNDYNSRTWETPAFLNFTG